jgi:crotonobetainyl-CoA:carnitine CoA-transferase CaiB-like acyl-CoA transferase
MTKPTAPLSHIRVLDLSRVLAGPWAAQFLADMGAEVIKIERPGEGDDTRGWGPPYLVEATADDPGMSAYFTCTNRGKKSVAVDMATPAGQDIIRRLAAKSDVLIENFKVGGLAKYGLDYGSLKVINPRLIYCSVTGFGQTGPYANRAGYDYLVQGMGGLMSVTGEADDVPGGGPMKVGVAIIDQVSGMNALAGILTALVARDRPAADGGVQGGCHIDVALLDASVSALINQATTYLIADQVPGRMGNAHPTVVPYQAFATADGHIILAIGNDGQFARFCAATASAALGADERYRTNKGRIINRDTLIPQLQALIALRSTAAWIGLLEQHAVPCGPINTLDRVFADAQVKHRRVRRVLKHPTIGQVAVVANPVRLTWPDQTVHDTTAQKAPPLLGEDTATVLRDVLGMSPAEIATHMNRPA